MVSDLSATVVIFGCDSGVENVLLDDGCTVSDLVSAALALGGEDALEDLLDDLVGQGLLSEDEAEDIEDCVDDEDDDED